MIWRSLSEAFVYAHSGTIRSMERSESMLTLEVIGIPYGGPFSDGLFVSERALRPLEQTEPPVDLDARLVPLYNIIRQRANDYRQWLAKLIAEKVLNTVDDPFRYAPGRDLKQTFFTPETDYGPLHEGLSYFDHLALEDAYPQFRDFFGRPIGKAFRIGQTEDGELFRIEIPSDYPYQELIRSLVASDLVRVSSSAYPRSVLIDADGRVLRWHWIEISLTPNPANPQAKVLAWRDQQEYRQEGTMSEKMIDQVLQEGAADAAMADAVDENASISMIQLLQGLTEEMASTRSQVQELLAKLEGLDIDLDRIADEVTEKLSSLFVVTAAQLRAGSSQESRALVERLIERQRAGDQIKERPTAPGRERRATSFRSVDEK